MKGKDRLEAGGHRYYFVVAILGGFRAGEVE